MVEWTLVELGRVESSAVVMVELSCDGEAELSQVVIVKLNRVKLRKKETQAEELPKANDSKKQLVASDKGFWFDQPPKGNDSV